jgi:hypothetical protein
VTLLFKIVPKCHAKELHVEHKKAAMCLTQGSGMRHSALVLELEANAPTTSLSK